MQINALITLLILATVATAGDPPKERTQAARDCEAKAAVHVSTAGGSGTGVVAYMYGQPMILTAAHVPTYTQTVRAGRFRTQQVRRVAQTATISDGTTTRPAVLLGYDLDTDVAVYGCKQIFDLDISIAEIATEQPPTGVLVASYGYGVRDGIAGLTKSSGRLTVSNDRYMASREAAFNGDSGGPVFYNGKLVGLIVRGRDGVPVVHGGDGGEPKSIAMAMTAITVAIKVWPYVKQVLIWVKEFREWRIATFGLDGYDRPILSRLIRGRAIEPEPKPEPAPEACPACPTPEVPIVEPVIEPPPSNLKPPMVITPEPKTIEPNPEPAGLSPWWMAFGPSLALIFASVYFGGCILGQFRQQKQED